MRVGWSERKDGPGARGMESVRMTTRPRTPAGGPTAVSGRWPSRPAVHCSKSLSD